MPPVFVVALSVVASAHASFDDSGFTGWFQDELREAFNSEMHFNGTVPDYLRGSFVQGGPGRFRIGDMRVGHVFDGFAKTHRVQFGKGRTYFTSYFVPTEFLNESLKIGAVATAMLMGETRPPSQGSRVVSNALDGHNDNNYIKAHKIGNYEMILSDTTVAQCFTHEWEHLEQTLRPSMAAVGLPHGRAWVDNDVAVADHVCLTGIMAHGHTDASTGVYTGMMGCMGIGPLTHDYHVVYTINPVEPERRLPLARIELPEGRKASVMHSMGHTANHVVLVAIPLHMSVAALLEGKTMTTGILSVGEGEETIFQVISRLDGSVRSFKAPSFFCGHIVNTFEDGGDIVLDLTWYQADATFMFYGIALFSTMENKTLRDSWAKPVLMRYVLSANGDVKYWPLLSKETATSFELPKVSSRVYGHKHCVFYAVQLHSYDYASSPSSRTAGPFGAMAVAKRNVCTGEVRGLYVPNEYPGEVEFIPDPAGSEEDDGVLVGSVFDGSTNTSFLQIIDARSMSRIATAQLPVRIPYPVHASFFPDVEQHGIVV